ncbi:MAG: glutathione peroxidase [Prolixibacteraceae bacterium]|nr:glutathione peroxidase [Prolixibacteraceae bacterium]
MKAYIFLITMFMGLGINAQNNTSLYDFTVKDIAGEDFSLKNFEGKKVLVVNTASKCGLTPQYEDLEKLYRTYKDSNFIIVGFPANNFLNQEPGSNEEIAEFCQINYGVTFPMMGKISVKGNDIHPLYKWLTESTDSKVSWNFQKYMIDEKGHITGYAAPTDKPFSKNIIDWIEGTLNHK